MKDREYIVEQGTNVEVQDIRVIPGFGDCDLVRIALAKPKRVIVATSRRITDGDLPLQVEIHDDDAVEAPDTPAPAPAVVTIQGLDKDNVVNIDVGRYRVDVTIYRERAFLPVWSKA